MVGNDRHDTTTADHHVEIGGHLHQQVQGDVSLQAGQRIVHRTRVYEIHVADTLVLKGPGGSLCIDGTGITLDGTALEMKAPLTIIPGGSTHTIAATGAPNISEPVCVGCLLKAIAEGSSLIPMEGGVS